MTLVGDFNALAYNSLWRLRGDAWGSLDDIGERLAAAATQGRPIERLVGELDDVFDLLEPIEHYWACPGVRRFERARRLFAAGDFGCFARFVAGLNRELATDSYRRVRHSAAWTRDDDLDIRDAAGVGRQATPVPYFEVLIVDELSPQQEAVLRDELHRLRRRPTSSSTRPS